VGPASRWLPALGGRLSRGAALFGLATLIVGLAAGYALDDRHSGQPPARRRRQRQHRPPPAPTTCSAWPRQENGPTDTAQLAGFPDLGLVASTECSSLTWPFFGISFLACRFTSRHLSLFRIVSDAHVPWMCPAISRASPAGQGYSGQSESMQLLPFAAEQ
jgi:hypothetical protein